LINDSYTQPDKYRRGPQLFNSDGGCKFSYRQDRDLFGVVLLITEFTTNPAWRNPSGDVPTCFFIPGHALEARRVAVNVAKTAEVYSKRSYTLVQ
jgi:hypothetical protein